MTASSRFERLPWTLALLGLFLALSALWTWPAARLDPELLVTTHFDLYPAIWLLELGRETFPGMWYEGSGWPVGESLSRVDSLVLLGVSWLNGGLLPGWLLVALMIWWGPALSALAAERCAARAFGVSRPWSLIPGLAFGFSGIAAVAVLEGHVYFLLSLWLPLLLWVAHVETRGAPTWRNLLIGAALGALWALCLYTSAYFGILATVLLAALLPARRLQLVRLLPGALPVVALAGGWYLYLFFWGTSLAGVSGSLVLAEFVGTSSLLGLTGWHGHIDQASHSNGAPLGAVLTCLLLMAPFVLRGRPGWRPLVAIALLALLASMGSEIKIHEDGRGILSPLAPLFGLPLLEFFRFQIRFLWLFYLCGGLVAGMVAMELAGRGGYRRALALLPLAALDPFVVNALPFRTTVALAAPPSAYAAAPEDGAVLDLYGGSLADGHDDALIWRRSLSCYYQAHHRRPVLESCISTHPTSSRLVVDMWLTRAILADPDMAPRRAREIRRRLGELGVGSVALHLDYLHAVDRVLMAEGLAMALGPAAAETADGGERVALYTVAEEGGRDPLQAWRAIDTLFRSEVPADLRRQPDQR